MTREERWFERLAQLDGERVRLTYLNTSGTAVVGTKTGVLSTRDYGHCVDVLLDNRGGAVVYPNLARVEVMQENGRYAAAEGVDE